MKGKFASISEISQLVELAVFHYKAYHSKMECDEVNESHPEVLTNDVIEGEPGVHFNLTAAI